MAPRIIEAILSICSFEVKVALGRVASELFICCALLFDLQRHHRKNFPPSIARHVLSAVALIFRRVADVPNALRSAKGAAIQIV